MTNLNPEKSKTPHIFHAYNFNNLNGLENSLKQTLRTVFDPMIELQNRLAGTSGDLQDLEAQYILHPQIIHYPVGGGYFEKHIHPFEPQKFGLIVSLSEKGKHFQTGATLYYDQSDQETDLDHTQTIGSLTIFKYDIPHAVGIVDKNNSLSFDQPSGRWSAILPYY